VATSCEGLATKIERCARCAHVVVDTFGVAVCCSVVDTFGGRYGLTHEQVGQVSCEEGLEHRVECRLLVHTVCAHDNAGV